MPTPDSNHGSAGSRQRPEPVRSAFTAAPLPTGDLSTAHARARAKLVYGLACDVELEDRSMRVDAPSAEGGTATGPSPAQLLRASLSASLLMGCRRWAARLDVPLDELAVEIAIEHTIPSATAPQEPGSSGWDRIRIELRVSSRAPKARVRAVVETAYRLNSVLALIARDVERVFLVHIATPDGA